MSLRCEWRAMSSESEMPKITGDSSMPQLQGCTMHWALGSLLMRRTRRISFVCLFRPFHECSVLMCVADYLIPRRTLQKLCSFWPISLQEPKALTK